MGKFHILASTTHLGVWVQAVGDTGTGINDEREGVGKWRNATIAGMLLQRWHTCKSVVLPEDKKKKTLHLKPNFLVFWHWRNPLNLLIPKSWASARPLARALNCTWLPKKSQCTLLVAELCGLRKLLSVELACCTKAPTALVNASLSSRLDEIAAPGQTKFFSGFSSVSSLQTCSEKCNWEKGTH